MNSDSEGQFGKAEKGAADKSEGGGWEDFGRLYGKYVSGIAVLKDTLDVMWKLAPIGLLMPAMLIWSYLKKIGWQQLFPQAVVSVSGLVVMIVSSCLLTFLLAIQFALPSMMSVTAFSLYDEQSKIVRAAGAGSLRHPIALLFIGAPLSWLLVFGTLLTVFDMPVGWCFFLSVVGMFGFEFLIVRLYRPVFLDARKVGRMDRIIHFMQMITYPSFSAAFIIPSLAFCLGVFSAENFSNWMAFGVFVACVFYCVMGVVPGVVYLVERMSGKKPIYIFKATAIVGAAVFYLIAVVALEFGPFTYLILRSIGAIDDKRYVYQVLKSDLVTGLQGAGFKVYRVGPSLYNKDSTYFVDGYVRFNFSNVLLLCRDSLNFKKADGFAMTNVDVKEKLKVWESGGYFCVGAHTDDVRLLQSRRNL
ncbi:hypothetical protein GAS19_11630 [Burkholderia glumae]|uniref:hypothetical protein n=1 Tax=Burkholderia glumae TaxID=337 RepID=UPI001296E5A7|nr:hypothetical protein [Burkholderia glumae]QGA38200.1 hypothetical protein GAS19_11630 [Burkholderia glumae]